MHSQLALFPQGVILDACCLLNVLESGYASEIISSIGQLVAVAEYVAIYEMPRQDLRAFTEGELLKIISHKADDGQDDEDELNTFIDLACRMDDGEAHTAAIAIHRSLAIATDDRKARAHLSTRFPHLTLLTTPQLIRSWVEVSNPPKEIIRTVLQNVRVRARYEPGGSDPLSDWWKEQRR